MVTLTIYSADTSALIHGWRRIYRPKNFGFIWERLGVLIDEGRLKASIEVYNDLERKDDELFKWCKERKDNLVVDIDANIQAHVARIMKTHPRLVDTVKGRSGSDPFVIALAAWISQRAPLKITPSMPGLTPSFSRLLRYWSSKAAPSSGSSAFQPSSGGTIGARL